jgi:hypothetical protein
LKSSTDELLKEYSYHSAVKRGSARRFHASTQILFFLVQHSRLDGHIGYEQELI